MSMMRVLPAAAFTGLLWLVAGCSSAPTEIRIQGIPVPGSWVDRAENRSEGGSGQAQACLSLAKKLWDRDVLESLRYLRRGSELRDAECCRQYLAHSESTMTNVSQRVYARLFMEGLLRKGPLVDQNGEDVRAELFAKLCSAWRYTDPVSLPKVKQLLEAMLRTGALSTQTPSNFLGEMLRETGLSATLGSTRSVRREEINLYAGESADDTKGWLSVPAQGGNAREIGPWIVSEASAWGGGTDRLLLSANVLAFLVNAQGEPSFRGDHLWICNLGASPIYLNSLAVGMSNWELLPGHEEVLPLASAGLGKGRPTTSIPLSVRHHRMIR